MNPITPQAQSLTLQELLQTQFPEPIWVVESLLPEGLTILSGGPKMGKSWLALDIALAVSTEGMLFENLEVHQGKAIYIALEDNFRRLKERCQKLLNQSQTPNDNLIFFEQFDKLDEAGVGKLNQLIEQHPDVVLIIIDTWGRARPQTNNRQAQYEQETALLGAIQRLAVDKGLAVLVIHHTRKGKGMSEDPFEDVLGSTAITGVADTNLILTKNRKTGEAMLLATGRDTKDQEIALQFNQETMKWSLTNTVAELPLNQTFQKILACFETKEDIYGPKEVSEKSKLDYGLVKTSMARMVKAGLLFKQERGKYALVVALFQNFEKPDLEIDSADTWEVSPFVSELNQELGEYLRENFDLFCMDSMSQEVVPLDMDDIPEF